MTAVVNLVDRIGHQLCGYLERIKSSAVDNAGDDDTTADDGRSPHIWIDQDDDDRQRADDAGDHHRRLTRAGDGRTVAGAVRKAGGHLASGADAVVAYRQPTAPPSGSTHRHWADGGRYDTDRRAIIAQLCEYRH